MQRERARLRRKQSLTRAAWIAAGTAVAAVALVIAVSPRPATSAQIPTPVARPFPVEGKTLGAAGAPVVLDEYSDFQ